MKKRSFGIPTTVIELFVSPTGSDADAGTEAKPFKSLERARDAARKFKGDRGVVVWLSGGLYEREKPFELTAEDSGSPEKPVVWRGRPGEEVRIVGGKVVTEWKPVTDAAVLARLVPEARGKVFQADLKALGIADYGRVKGGGLHLFFDDKPMPLARWPKDGFIKITGLVEPDTVEEGGVKNSKTGKFMYEGDRPKRWAGEKDLWVHGFWCVDYADDREKVESIDTERRIISVLPPYFLHGYRVGQWFYALNILAELDTPGEWYLDRETGILYFWPPTPLEKGRAVVSVTNTLVSLTDVSHVTLQGMILEAARGMAVTITGGAQTKIAGCILRNLGGWGVIIKGGAQNGVVGCDIYQTNGGISLDWGWNPACPSDHPCAPMIGAPDDLNDINRQTINRQTLTPAGHFADNNHIYYYGLWKRVYQPAILIGGVGNRATHNLIHDAPHTAIQFSGNDHLIEFNEIYNVCQESNDAGAVYSSFDWTRRGAIIRHNYLHHINGFQGRGCVGIYLDDMTSGTTVRGNVFYQVVSAAFIGGGRDNLVENNIFVDCRPSLHVDSRGMGWAKESVNTAMMERLNAMPYKSDLWRKRYPELVNILEDEPAAPKGNVITRNISWGGKWDDIDPVARPYVTVTNNLVDQNPLFEDKPPKSFRLLAASPAYAIGFEPIPFERIGLCKDEYRSELPAK